MELLLWDAWGLMEREPSAEDLARLDRVAELSLGGNAAFMEIQAMYRREADLKVPPVVRSDSPAAAPREVKLAL
jgi:hypothetical protein